MEPQIDTGASRGTGFDVPEQGLHLRGEPGGPHRGVLDTSAGPVPVHIDVDGDEVEVVVGVPEQFVALTAHDDGYDGTLVTDRGDLPARDIGGDITIGEQKG
jgi:hypothetical protein